MRSAQKAIPSKQRSLHQKKWETSKTTLDLVEKRKAEWDKLGSEQVKQLSKEISRSARDDYRTYVRNIIEDIERENSAGNITNVFRLSRHLSSKQKSNLSVQPAIDAQGNVITSNEQQLECWAEFLDSKFAARDNESLVDLTSGADDEAESVAREELERYRT